MGLSMSLNKDSEPKINIWFPLIGVIDMFKNKPRKIVVYGYSCHTQS